MKDVYIVHLISEFSDHYYLAFDESPTTKEYNKALIDTLGDEASYCHEEFSGEVDIVYVKGKNV